MGYKGRGAPCKHGHKFKLNDPETWPEVTETLEVEDPKIGQVKVMLGCGFHFRQSPNRAMEIIHVEVIKPVGRNRKFQPLRLRLVGPDDADGVFILHLDSKKFRDILFSLILSTQSAAIGYRFSDERSLKTKNSETSF